MMQHIEQEDIEQKDSRVSGELTAAMAVIQTEFEVASQNSDSHALGIDARRLWLALDLAGLWVYPNYLFDWRNEKRSGTYWRCVRSENQD